MQTSLNLSQYRLMWAAGSALILYFAVGICTVMAWSPTLTEDNSIAPPPSTALPTSNPLEEKSEMAALLDLHRQARNGVLTQTYKIIICLADEATIQ